MKNGGDEYIGSIPWKAKSVHFLELFFSTTKDQTMQTTQRRLMDKTLKATGMEYCKAKPTPCSPDRKPLGTNPSGSPAKVEWSYPSVIGILLYLAGNSRPDIA
jgi:hypothetical protein